MISIVQMSRQSYALVILALPLVVLVTLYAIFYHDDTAGHDVYYLWLEGKRIIDGENPYARVLEGNMLYNNKYATYFPVFYWLSGFTQLAGFRDYPTWVLFWKIIFDMAHAGTGLLIFWILWQQSLLLGIFGGVVWWFNRWSINVIGVANMDFLPVFFLLLSMYWFERRPNSSLLLFGLSLGLKQIGIFMLPVYLIWVWQREPSLKRLVVALLLISGITIVAATPFLLRNPASFVMSILFSATRLPQSGFGIMSIDAQFGLVGLPAKFPMAMLLLMLYAGVWQRAIRKFTAGLLTMTVFIDFNSVFFEQYLVWAAPFFPLLVCDYAEKLPNTFSRNQLPVS
jgi:uncharacterized membrane protein